MSRVGEEAAGGGGSSGAKFAGDSDLGKGNRASLTPGGDSGGASSPPQLHQEQRPTLAFAWVASHEGEAGPHTAALARNTEWAAVARDVRFRLAGAWLSCEQVLLHNG